MIKIIIIRTFSYFGVGHGDGAFLGTLVYKINAHLDELGIRFAGDVNVRFEPINLMVGQKIKPHSAGNGLTISNIRLETAAKPPVD